MLLDKVNIKKLQNLQFINLFPLACFILIMEFLIHILKLTIGISSNSEVMAIITYCPCPITMISDDNTRFRPNY